MPTLPLPPSSAIAHLHSQVAVFDSGQMTGSNFGSENTLSDNCLNPEVTHTAVSPRLFTHLYHLRANTNVLTSDPDYILPLRPRITILSRDENKEYYVYDGFTPQYCEIKILKCSFSVGLGTAGEFQIDIEDSDEVIDRFQVGNGNKVYIEVGKTQDQYERVFSGYVRKVKWRRDDTGLLVYEFVGFGSAIRLNERITNFSRASKRLEFASNVPRRNDKGMTVIELARDLLRDTDHLPIAEPVESQFDIAELEELDEEERVTESIPSVVEHLTTFAQALNDICDPVGAFWFVDPFDKLTIKYPSTSASGVVIKDKGEDDDRGDTTSYAIGSWDMEDTISKEDGFGNRQFGQHNAIETSSVASSEAANAYESLFAKVIGQQFTPGSTKFRNIGFIMSRVGEPAESLDALIHGRIVLDNGHNRPDEDKIVASFAIPLREVENEPSPVFRINILPHVSNIQIDKKHWILIYEFGKDEDNTIRWHHDNDTNTPNRFSTTGRPGARNISTARGFTISSKGPIFTHSILETKVHTTEASDSLSIARFGVIEEVDNADWIEEAEMMDKYLSAKLSFSAKEKRGFNIGAVTPPDKPIFPGTIVQIIDEKVKFTKENHVTAEVVDVSYDFDADANSVGTNVIGLSLVGFVELGGFPDVIGEEAVSPEDILYPVGYPAPVSRQFIHEYNIHTPANPPKQPGTQIGRPKVDKFGIRMLYPTTKTNKVGGIIGREWFATKWANGKKRRLCRVGERDPYDSEIVFRGDGEAEIMGNGECKLSGRVPRLFHYDKAKKRRWENVELTFYAKRVRDKKKKRRKHHDDDFDDGMHGFCAGVRSNHQDYDDCPCNGATYYAWMEYDGRVFFEKEILHGPNGFAIKLPLPLTKTWWRKFTQDNTLPFDRWVGFKFVIRTRETTGQVLLELWRDLTDGKSTVIVGGQWVKMIEVQDSGGWTNPRLKMKEINKLCNERCKCYDKPGTTDPIITRAGISCFIRNDGIQDSRYKWASIREIDPLPN